ncbi:MAG: gliding motility-associated C-terminal domain-containing protein [Cyclobacteriaceae bacterium]
MDEAAAVRVLQPARNIEIGSAYVAANTTQTIDLTSHIGNLETIYAARAMNTGIRIISSAPVTAYYEIAAGANADIFALKGRNGLGNNFVIPGQNLYHTDGGWAPPPSSSFDIVASQNNTIVKVWPTQPIIGHLSDSVITVKLNAGETYSFRKPGGLAEENPAGTIVKSNKPIAITIKDDSIITGCADLIGDQLVPVEVAGSEYVVLKGFLNIPEYLFITATEDDTQIFVNGDSNPVMTLSAGQLFNYEITGKSTYVLASKTIYIFHITGSGCEVGLAILPSINCKGSRQIGFSRTTHEFFGLNILVRKEGIDHFKLNGSFALVPSSAFTAVPGTGGNWYAAQLTFNTNQIAVGQTCLISNSQNSFQIGIIGCTQATCSYGYFSSFSTLFIGDDFDMCEGESATLDAGPGKESYLWSTGETTEEIDVSAAGEYWVRAEREGCVLYDTIRVDVKKGTVDIGPDLEICPGDTARIDGKENFRWEWSDGSTDQILKIKTAGEYWVNVFDYTGCEASDTVMVSLKDGAVENPLGENILKCRDDEVLLDASFPGATYLWENGDDSISRVIGQEGLYWVRITWGECSMVDSVRIENYPGPLQDSIFGSPSVCPFVEGIDYSIDAVPHSSYQWFVSGGMINWMEENTIKIDWYETNSNALVRALVTDGNGCKGDTIFYPVRINVVLLPEIPFGPDSLCLNKSQQIVYHTPETNGSVYQWNISGGEITSGQGTAEVRINWTKGLNRLWIEETSTTIDTVCQGTSPVLTVNVFELMAEVILNFVSVDTAVNNRININWRIAHQETVLDDHVELSKRLHGSADWQLVTPLSASTDSFADNEVDFFTDEIFDYYLSLVNFCDEVIATDVHSTVFLSGSGDAKTDVIDLRWNHYHGWPLGIHHYEVWRKIDGAGGYRFLALLPGEDTNFSASLGSDGFLHQYVIRAVENSGPNESWSNMVKINFEHTVTIPNVITPNGDEFNQHFHISKIGLYKNSRLIIMDRWGKKVYDAVNYNNDWSGEGLAPGVYYFVLDLRRNNKTHKGLMSILR